MNGKNIVVVLFATIVTGGLAAAATCEPAAQYQVRDMNFDRIPLGQALAQAVEGTPLGIDMESHTPLKIGARHVSGPLDVVLNKMAGFAHVMWSQSGCIVHVRLDPSDTRGSVTTPALAKPAPSTHTSLAQTNPPHQNTNALHVSDALPQHVRIRLWQVTAGASLNQTIAAWAAKAGWTPYWELPKDKVYTVSSDATFTGNFRAAVMGLVAALNARGVWLHAHFSGGNRVLEIWGTSMPQVGE